MTTLPPGHRGARIAFTTAKLQQLQANNSEMTTFAESRNDREMQRPWNDKPEAQHSLPKVYEILHRFVAVVVLSAFRKSLMVVDTHILPSSLHSVCVSIHKGDLCPVNPHFGGLAVSHEIECPAQEALLERGRVTSRYLNGLACLDLDLTYISARELHKRSDPRTWFGGLHFVWLDHREVI